MKNSVLTIFILLLIGCNTDTGGNNGGLDFVIEPYLQFATQKSMVVMWETNMPTRSVVEYGKARLNSGKPVLDKVVESDSLVSMHELIIDGLETETNYFYRTRSVTESGQELVSEINPFKTAVKDSNAYMFALVGDSQKNSKTPWAWERIAELVWQERPNFVVHVGDIVDDGNRLSDWTDHFFPGGRILMSRTPMYTALGNHENDSDYYYQYFHNPPPEYYYTFNYGNAQFFIIDTNRDVSQGSEQFTWLEWELAKSDATWKFVLHHHPPYSSEENDHGDTWKEASTHGTHARNLIPLYEQYGVDFNLFGHTHVYERTWPMKNDLVNQDDGVIYINSGGAGGGLEDFAPTRNWFTAELQTGHHYVTFAIYDRTLIFKAIDSEGRLFDTFQMVKETADSKATTMQPPAPKIFPGTGIFEGNQLVEMESVFDNLTIRYTTDGSEPTSRSKMYDGPFSISETSTIRARTFNSDGYASRINRAEFRKVQPIEGVSVSNPTPGLQYKYYEMVTPDDKLPDFSQLTPVSEGVIESVNYTDARKRDEYFLFKYEGYIHIEKPGRYTFFTESDDGSALYIHDEKIVDNDGSHSMRERQGDVILKEGYHPIRIEHFQNGGGFGLKASFESKEVGIPKQEIPSGFFKH